MYHFKLASNEDLKEIETIISESYQPIANTLSRLPGALERTLEKLSSTLRNDQLYVIYNKKQELIGTFSIVITEKRKAKMFHFAIKPQFQNKGLGTWVVTEVIKMIEKQMPEVKGIELEIYFKIPSLLRFYKKFGFNQTGEKQIRGEKILILSKYF